MTLADLIERLGNVPLSRVRMRPAPGTATEQDVIDIEVREKRYFELVDGVLVEKAMGYRESVIAAAIIAALESFVRPGNLGVVSGEGGMMRLFPGLVRIPDVAYASWARFPEGRLPEEPIPDLVPDLAVEVLSISNTEAEMKRKRTEYFDAGVRLVWIIDPRKRNVVVFSGPDEFDTLGDGDVIDGSQVLSGFRLPVRDLLARWDACAGS